ncbi:amidohydrolase family protein [Ekhidna sp.]
MKTILIILNLVACNYATAQKNYLINDVKLFDGYHVFEKVDVSIIDGRIDRIAKRIKHTSDMSLIDGAKKTIIPGLINSHVHAWIPYHLKNALEFGVFAVLDMNTSADLDELKSLKLEEGYARFYSTGFAATVENGHGTQYGYPVPTIGEARSPAQFVDEAYTGGSDYIKIIYEPSKPTLTPTQVTSIVKASKKYGYKTVAHISRKNHAVELAKTGIDGFAHLWKDGPIAEEELDVIIENGLFIIPTLSVIQGVIKYYEAEGIDLSFSLLETTLLEVKRLSNAGILLLAGTDPPNVGLDYGSSIHSELALFVKAGLTPVEALKTATSNVSQTFGIEDIGIIKEALMPILI